MKLWHYVVALSATVPAGGGVAALATGPTARLRTAPLVASTGSAQLARLPRAAEHERARSRSRSTGLGPMSRRKPIITRTGYFFADRVVPYLSRGIGGRARASLLEGNMSRAASLLERALAARPTHPERVRFVLAHTLMGLGRHAEALAMFLHLRSSYPLLRHETTYFAARCAYQAHQTLLAQGLASQVKGPGPFAARAQLLVGDTLRSQKRWRRAAQIYAALLGRGKGKPWEAEARLRLAQCLGRLPGKKLRRVASLLYRADSLAPHRVWGKLARRLLLSLTKKGRRPPRRSCTSLLLRSRSLSSAMRLRQSARALRRARRVGRCPVSKLCMTAAALGRLQARRRKYRRASLKTLRLARRACKRAGLAAPLAKVKYAAAKANAALGRSRRGLALFARVERDHPKSSLADDALYRSALLLFARGKTTQAEALLERMAQRYPKGDMLKNGLWRLAWRAYDRGDLRKALKLLERSWKIRRLPSRLEDSGRDGYWRARLLARLGQRERALAAFEEVVRRHPLTFYSLLALVRLRSAAPDRERRLVASLRPRPTRTTWRFGPSPLFRRPAFVRAVELARLGLGGLAAQELRFLSIRPPKRLPGEPVRASSAASPPPPTSGNTATASSRQSGLKRSRKEHLWAAAVLYDRAGLPQKSHWIVRWSLRDYAKLPPRGVNHNRWTVSFPRPWPKLVAANAKRNGLPTPLVYGLMREESAFNPRLISSAKAVGLMQLLRTTARRFHRGQRGRRGRRNRVTVSLLKVPGHNVVIGTRYLGWLVRLFEGNLVLAVAAYNAGETKAFEWIRKRGNLPSDHFIEAIPFRETRYYVKRVIGSAFAYSVLEGAADPVLAIPPVFSAKLVVKSHHWRRSVRRWARGRRAMARRRRARSRNARRRRARSRSARRRRPRSRSARRRRPRSRSARRRRPR